MNNFFHMQTLFIIPSLYKLQLTKVILLDLVQ